MKFRIFTTSHWLPHVTSSHPPPTGTLLLELDRHILPTWGLCTNLFLYLQFSSHQEWVTLPSNGLMERPSPKFLHKITPVATLSTHPVFLIFLALNMAWGLPQWLSSKESTCHAGDVGSIPWSGRSPKGGNGNPLQCSCLEELQFFLEGYSQWGCKELDMTEQHTHTWPEISSCGVGVDYLFLPKFNLHEQGDFVYFYSLLSFQHWNGIPQSRASVIILLMNVLLNHFLVENSYADVPKQFLKAIERPHS